MNKIVFITGATSGFGEACARIFARNHYNLILNGRRQDRLEQLKDQFEKEFGVQVYLAAFDVRNREAAFQTVNNLPETWQAIDLLINNAGLALGRDLFEEASLDDWDTMIDTNVKGLLYVSKAVVPLLVKRNKGHIINVGSIAGKEVYERGNVYCASKAAVDSISRAMRIDLLPHHIKVTAIHPGAADTEFSNVRFKGNAEAARKVYEGYEPLTAEDVASVIYYTASLPAHVCINDLVLTCTQQASSYHFNKSGKMEQ
ncbi:MAG TPA: SDR family NAD(P)-dependent oxidoreductase [Flavisolibacter sp.]|jgi:NADP-dependent 3-hydroxy acid dehydrogenase YdfG|nr:SDR family NAD(P)-dependent oxidoreductase [Flavisolibacter sp.]